MHGLRSRALGQSNQWPRGWHAALKHLMRQGTARGFLQLFGVIAVGSGAFGLWQGYGIGETLIAAVILSAFIVGIAWAGARMDRQLNRK